MTISYDDFAKVDIRLGTIIKAEPFPRAKKPSFKIWVDFGEAIGIKQTSAQVTAHYTPDFLLGKQVAGCINLEAKNIAGFLSEFLLLGFEDENGAICLVSVDPKAPNGGKMC